MITHHAHFTDVAANCFWNGLHRESTHVEIVERDDIKILSIPIDEEKVLEVMLLSESKTGINSYSPSVYMRNVRGELLATLDFHQASELIIGTDKIVGNIDPEQRRHFLAAVAESHRNTWVALEQFGQSLGESATTFLESEQSLYVGHSLHPAPKSRSNLSVEISRQLSPELKANFALRWFAVQDESVFGGAAQGSRWQQYLQKLQDHEAKLPSGASKYLNQDSWKVIPMHPWQAQQLLVLPQVKDLIETGKLIDLGLGSRPGPPLPQPEQFITLRRLICSNFL